MTVYFLKDLISGNKKFIKQKDIQHLQIPNYEGLAIKDIGEFLSGYPDVENFLPEV